MNGTLTYYFDRAKPFYPLIMNYLVQLLGFKELAVRGLIGPRQVDAELSRSVSDRIQKTASKQIEESRTGIASLLGPLELRSEFLNKRISADADEICKELANNASYLLPYYFRAAGFLLVLAHEMSKEKDYNDRGQLWEFLRHCRNAVGHDGLFYFNKCEPKRPAVWGLFTIDRDLQGTLLFKDVQGSGLLSPGDPIRLLWDIEQAYPNMSA